MNCLRLLQVYPHHAFSKTVEYCLALGCEDFGVPELMLEFLTRTGVADMNLATKTAADRVCISGNVPAIAGHLPFERHGATPLFHHQIIDHCVYARRGPRGATSGLPFAVGSHRAAQGHDAVMHLDADVFGLAL